jgi:excisionase family DNA binding protein
MTIAVTSGRAGFTAAESLRCAGSARTQEPVLPDESSIRVEVPTALVEAIAKRTAELIGRELASGSPWLKTAEAAEYLRLPLGRLRNLTAEDAIPHHHQGKAVIYHKSELDAWALDGNR